MPVLTRLDECLSKRDGHLFIEDCDILDLVRQFGSPIFVLSEDQIRCSARRFQAAFQQGWPKPASDTHVCRRHPERQDRRTEPQLHI